MAKTFLLEDFVGGWFVGDFTPSLLRSSEVEVCVKYLSRGEREPAHFQIAATEWTVVASGECRIGDAHLGPGCIVEIPPKEVADFEALTDVILVAVKSPSLPSDKAFP